MKNIKTRNFILIALIISIFMSLMSVTLIMINTDTVFAETESSNLTYTLNADGTGYSVKAANRQITEAIIPSRYNGLSVLEIANNGFLSCANLEKVIIPETVLKVGNNAFMNCKSLKSLRGMANVTEIGNYAFAMCTQLNNLIIPSRVEKLGSSIIQNLTNTVYVRATEQEIQTLNANWDSQSSAEVIYGNDLCCEPIYEGDSILGYSVLDWQNMNPPDNNPDGIIDFEGFDIDLLCSYKNAENEEYYPILEIQGYAFACMQFNSLTIKYDTENIDKQQALKIGDAAFMAVEANFISIEVEIVLDDLDGDRNGLFAGASIEKNCFTGVVE